MLNYFINGDLTFQCLDRFGHCWHPAVRTTCTKHRIRLWINHIVTFNYVTWIVVTGNVHTYFKVLASIEDLAAESFIKLLAKYVWSQGGGSVWRWSNAPKNIVSRFYTSKSMRMFWRLGASYAHGAKIHVFHHTARQLGSSRTLRITDSK